MSVRDNMMAGKYDLVAPRPELPKMVCPNTKCKGAINVTQKFCVSCGESIEDHIVNEMGDYRTDVHNQSVDMYNKFLSFKKDFLSENNIPEMHGCGLLFNFTVAKFNEGRYIPA